MRLFAHESPPCRPCSMFFFVLLLREKMGLANGARRISHRRGTMLLQERGLDNQLRMALSLPTYPYDINYCYPALVTGRYLFFWTLSRTAHVTLGVEAAACRGVSAFPCSLWLWSTLLTDIVRWTRDQVIVIMPKMKKANLRNGSRGQRSQFMQCSGLFFFSFPGYCECQYNIYGGGGAGYMYPCTR